MLATIILHVCLLNAAIGDETQCHDVFPPVEITWSECNGIDGQIEGQRWIFDHPKWRLAGVRCRIQTSGPERDS